MRKISSKKTYEGIRFSVIRTILSKDNELIEKEFIDFGEAVAIVPFINSNKIILIKQYRAALDKWIYEIPAGKIERGEDIYSAAARELVEETGYEPGSLEKILSIYTAPGYSNEVIHILVARDLVFVGARPEAGEFISTEIIDLEEAIKKIFSQEVIDAKTLIGLLIARDLLHTQSPTHSRILS